MQKDASRSPLERTYFGPFKVIYKADKYFTLFQNGVLNNVSINRIKTAHLPLFHADDSLQSSTCEATENVYLSFDDASSSPSPQLPELDPVFRRIRMGRVIRTPAILDLKFY